MVFKGSAIILPDRSNHAAELLAQGLVPLPLPNGGGRVYVEPEDITGSTVDLVFEISAHVERARDEIGRARWAREFKRGKLSPTSDFRIVLGDVIREV